MIQRAEDNGEGDIIQWIKDSVTVRDRILLKSGILTFSVPHNCHSTEFVATNNVDEEEGGNMDVHQDASDTKKDKHTPECVRDKKHDHVPASELNVHHLQRKRAHC